jgi:Zn-dependent protease/CBS domain-containing protein
MSDDDRRTPTPALIGRGLQVGRILGVPVVIQPIWFLVVGLVTISFEPAVRDRAPSLGPTAAYAVALVFVLLLYGSVLVHEISHVAVARALGMEVRRIVLQLFGGVSEVIEEVPGQPSREYLVAAVGPLTSVLLGGVGLAVIPLLADGSVPRLLAEEFAFANLFVAAFNALPGLPLDGGRVLRALLWQVTHDKSRGTLAAGWVGRGLAIAIMVVAVLRPGGWGGSGVAAIYLLFLAFYIWTSASMAITQARVSEVLPRLDLRLMSRRALPVTADLPVAEAVRRARDFGARALIVVDGTGKPNGLVSESAVGSLPTARQPWVSISELARPLTPPLILRTDMDGESLLDAVQRTPASEYLVVDRVGAVFGVLARADLVAALNAAGVR